LDDQTLRAILLLLSFSIVAIKYFVN